MITILILRTTILIAIFAVVLIATTIPTIASSHFSFDAFSPISFDDVFQPIFTNTHNIVSQQKNEVHAFFQVEMHSPAHFQIPVTMTVKLDNVDLQPPNQSPTPTEAPAVLFSLHPNYDIEALREEPQNYFASVHHAIPIIKPKTPQHEALYTPPIYLSRGFLEGLKIDDSRYYDNMFFFVLTLPLSHFNPTTLHWPIPITVEFVYEIKDQTGEDMVFYCYAIIEALSPEYESSWHSPFPTTLSGPEYELSVKIDKMPAAAFLGILGSEPNQHDGVGLSPIVGTLQPGYFSALQSNSKYPSCSVMEYYSTCGEGKNNNCEMKSRIDTNYLVSVHVHTPLLWRFTITHNGPTKPNPSDIRVVECGGQLVATDPYFVDWRVDEAQIFNFSTEKFNPYRRTFTPEPEPMTEPELAMYDNVVKLKWGYWRGVAQRYHSVRQYALFLPDGSLISYKQQVDTMETAEDAAKRMAWIIILTGVGVGIVILGCLVVLGYFLWTIFSPKRNMQAQTQMMMGGNASNRKGDQYGLYSSQPQGYDSSDAFGSDQNYYEF